MKAEIENGMLKIIPESKTEDYAIDKWFEDHKDGCSYLMKPLDMRFDIGSEYYKEKIKLPLSLKMRFWFEEHILMKKPQFDFNQIGNKSIPK